MQSRQPFFIRQRIDVINEYLDGLLTDNKKIPLKKSAGGARHNFQAGEQEQAWAYFWDKVVAR